MNKSDFAVKEVFRGWTEAPLLLYLLEHGPTGIGELLKQGIASNTGLYRAIQDLSLAELVEYDKSGRKAGRPLMLTSRGKAIALKVKAIETLLQEQASQ